jgi:hypothetical protein
MHSLVTIVFENELKVNEGKQALLRWKRRAKLSFTFMRWLQST